MAYPGARYLGQYDATPPAGSGGSTHLLHPILTDDGWGGALTFTWTQVSGPDTATITDPTALETDVAFPDVSGTYLFQITVSRELDAFAGAALWRVAVFAGTTVFDDDARGAITVTVNGVARTGLVNSVRISETLRGTNTCQFSIYGGRQDDPDAADGAIGVFNDVVVTRHHDGTDTELRLFGGVCLSSVLTVEQPHLFYHPSLVDYAWHLGRVRVTRTYTNWDLGSIARDLLSLAPGGITPDFVAVGLPVASIGFTDVTPAEALTTLCDLEQDLHWTVDYFKRLHFAVLETDGDPAALTPDHPSLSDLAITTDGSQVVNQVRVYYTTPVPEPADADQTAAPPAPIVGTVSPGDTEIQVQSLDGYSPAGGTLALNGSVITYSGTRSGLIDSVYPVAIGYLTRRAVLTANGDLPPSITPYSYSATFSTSEGETPAVFTFSAVGIVEDESNAIEIALFRPLGEPKAVKRITAINLYRTSGSWDPPHAGDTDATFFVGSVGPRGGTVVDAIPKADLAPIQPIPFVNTADVLGYWLTGVTVTKPIASGTPVETYVEVIDYAAQAALAAALGGGSGVIAFSIRGGSITAAEARTLGLAFLASSVDTRLSVACGLRDDRAHPGQILSCAFPAPIDLAIDLKIQQATISGFAGTVPHAHTVTAAQEVVTLDDLLRHAADDRP